MTQNQFDVLIVGSGLAGLSAALHLAPTHRVAPLTKRGIGDGSSGWAQGGIAAVLGAGDSFDAHVSDTLIAGAGLSDPAATRFVVELLARAAAERIVSEPQAAPGPLPAWDDSRVTDADEAVVISHNWHELR